VNQFEQQHHQHTINGRLLKISELVEAFLRYFSHASTAAV